MYLQKSVCNTHKCRFTKYQYNMQELESTYINDNPCILQHLIFIRCSTIFCIVTKLRRITQISNLTGSKISECYFYQGRIPCTKECNWKRIYRISMYDTSSSSSYHGPNTSLWVQYCKLQRCASLQPRSGSEDSLDVN